MPQIISRRDSTDSENESITRVSNPLTKKSLQESLRIGAGAGADVGSMIAPTSPVDEDTASSSEFSDANSWDMSCYPSPNVSPVTKVVPDFAFAFDIDGVLLKGGEVIPEAVEALKVLNGKNEFGIEIPYIFVTNGGGKTEAERCQDLSKQLETVVSPDQFICGHSPMREMADVYGTVLVVGGEGEKCRDVAKTYGFKNIVTPGDLMKSNPAVTPFRKLKDSEHNSCKELDLEELEIEAIFVFADSRHWGDDAQIILELLMSKNGRMGTLSETFEEGPPIYWSHNDVVWATNYELNRYGMGAFRVFVESMYKHQTGKDLKTSTAFGKPQIGTYQFATRVLEQWRESRFGAKGTPKTVYFVGDTCESDIKGTNQYHETVDEEWYSILVETGVYAPGSVPAHEPRKIAKNVLDAVLHGIKRSHVGEAGSLAKDLVL